MKKTTQRRPYGDIGANGPLPDWHGVAPPEPESLKLFGTTWLSRGRGYWWRRCYTAAIYFLTALVMTLLWVGAAVFIARALPLPLGIVFGCALAFLIVPWSTLLSLRYARRGRQADFRPVEDELAGGRYADLVRASTPALLIVPFVFSLVEAPGEHRARLRYEESMQKWEKRQARVRASEARET